MDKGQPNLGSPGLLPEALGLWERGKRVFHTGESEHSLDEQRLSMVLELYYRKAGGREKAEERERERERERGKAREKERIRGRERRGEEKARKQRRGVRARKG